MAMVGIVIGSKTDEPFIKPVLEILTQLGIEYQQIREAYEEHKRKLSSS